MCSVCPDLVTRGLRRSSNSHKHSRCAPSFLNRFNNEYFDPSFRVDGAVLGGEGPASWPAERGLRKVGGE
jgi:hypothetical protein